VPRSGPISRALAASLRTAPAAPSDAAAVALAKRYAALLDDSAPGARVAKALEALRSVIPADDDAASSAFRTVAVALSAHSTASDLGPKLRDLLTALELTPAGRKIARGEAAPDERPQQQPTARGVASLEAARRERAARQERT